VSTIAKIFPNDGKILTSPALNTPFEAYITSSRLRLFTSPSPLFFYTLLSPSIPSCVIIIKRQN